MIYIESKKRKYERLLKDYPAADILDITSTSEAKYAQLLSPFYRITCKFLCLSVYH